ncbi:MAG: hypothetical protein AABX32_01035 [Nanoarchaeota archaeon]
MKIKIIFFILLILLAGCAKSGNYDIKNLSVEKMNPLQKALDIANRDNEVRSVLQNVEYSVEAKKVDQNEMQKMPYLYKGLSGNLYKVTYTADKFDLIAITNEEKVLNVFVVNKMVI